MQERDSGWRNYRPLVSFLCVLFYMTGKTGLPIAKEYTLTSLPSLSDSPGSCSAGSAIEMTTVTTPTPTSPPIRHEVKNRIMRLGEDFRKIIMGEIGRKWFSNDKKIRHEDRAENVRGVSSESPCAIPLRSASHFPKIAGDNDRLKAPLLHRIFWWRGKSSFFRNPFSEYCLKLSGKEIYFIRIFFVPGKVAVSVLQPAHRFIASNHYIESKYQKFIRSNNLVESKRAAISLLLRYWSNSFSKITPGKGGRGGGGVDCRWQP